jgi:hypothetical protein
LKGLSEESKQSEVELIEQSVSIISDAVENSIMERPECQSSEPSTSYSCKDSYCEKADQPSPISVLEPFFSDDVLSPNCKITDHGIDLFSIYINHPCQIDLSSGHLCLIEILP